MKIQIGTDYSTNIDQEIKTLTNLDVIKNTFKKSGLFFLLGILSIAIPVFHFVLVPFFLALSLIRGYSTIKNRNYIDLTSVKCPKCHTNLNEKQKYFNGNYLVLYCYECKNQLKIS